MNRQNDKKRKRSSDFQITEQYLMLYLEGKMSPEEQHHFEYLMEQDPFLRDAAEGLSALSKKEVTNIVMQLNAGLRKQTRPGKRRVRFFFSQKLLIWLAVWVVLLLVLMAWWYIQIILA